MSVSSHACVCMRTHTHIHTHNHNPKDHKIMHMKPFEPSKFCPSAGTSCTDYEACIMECKPMRVSCLHPTLKGLAYQRLHTNGKGKGERGCTVTVLRFIPTIASGDETVAASPFCSLPRSSCVPPFYILFGTYLDTYLSQ